MKKQHNKQINNFIEKKNNNQTNNTFYEKKNPITKTILSIENQLKIHHNNQPNIFDEKLNQNVSVLTGGGTEEGKSSFPPHMFLVCRGNPCAILMVAFHAL